MSSTPEGEGGKLLFCIPFRRFIKRNKKVQPRESLPLEKREDTRTTADTLKSLEDEVTKVKAEAAEATRKLKDETQQLKELLEAQKKEAVHKDTDIKRLGQEGETMRAKLAELRAADARAKELSKVLTETKKLLDERTTELSAAQVFLTKVDDVSESEVVGMINNLNTLICSASGALSDTWDQREPIPGTLNDELEQIRQLFGDSMADQIAARNPVAVNLAVQMHLGQFIERITSGWGGGPAETNLAKIYGMISTKESQTVASRWRTLTKSHTPYQEAPRIEDIIEGLARILMVTESFADFTEAAESIAATAGLEIKAIIEATLELDSTIKTKVASSDMSVYVVLPGTIFSEQTMDDEFGEDGSKGGGVPTKVAGTMEVGLLQRLGDVEKVLRKPKVILEPDLVEPEE